MESYYSIILFIITNDEEPIFLFICSGKTTSIFFFIFFKYKHSNLYHIGEDSNKEVKIMEVYVHIYINSSCAMHS